MNKLDIKAFGLATGILWSFYILCVGLLASQFQIGTRLVEMFGAFYVGYKPTLLGSLLGAMWSFVDGLVGGIVFAWLYNKLSRSQSRS